MTFTRFGRDSFCPHGAGPLGSLAVFLLAVWIAASTSVCGGSPDSTPPLKPELSAVLAKAKELVVKGDRKTAYSILMQLRSRLGASERQPKVEALIARILIEEGRSQSAIKYVEPFTQDRLEYRRDWVDAYLQYGNALVEIGQLEDAKTIFDWVASNENDKDLTIQAFAAEGVGRVCLAQKDYGEAGKAFNFGIHNLDAYLKILRKQSDGAELSDEAQALLKRLRGLLKETRDRAFAERVGEAHVLYVSAQKLRRGGRFEDARRGYEKIIQEHTDTTYADAARLYSPLCLVGLGGVGNIKLAERELQAFVDSEPELGFYRGEAMLRLGRIALEYRVDPGRADTWFGRLDKWIASVRLEPKIPDLVGVKPDAAQLVEPPVSEWQDANIWGYAQRTSIGADALLNRRTCSWYLDNLEVQCAYYRGFQAFVDKKYDEAISQYQRALALDDTLSDGKLQSVQNNYTRLRWGAEHGYLFAYPEELELYRDRRLRTAVLLADFYYVTERWDLSAAIHRRLLAGEFGSITGAQSDYPRFCIAWCAYRKGFDKDGDLEEAIRHSIEGFEAVLRQPHGTLTGYRAAFMICQLASDFPDDAKLQARRERLLHWVAYEARPNRMTYKARLAYALYLINTEEAVNVKKGLGVLKSEFPPSSGRYADIASYYFDKMSKSVSAKEK